MSALPLLTAARLGATPVDSVAVTIEVTTKGATLIRSPRDNDIVDLLDHRIRAIPYSLSFGPSRDWACCQKFTILTLG